MLSNVIVHGNKENCIIKQWLQERKYKIIALDYDIRSKRNEIIIINYKP